MKNLLLIVAVALLGACQVTDQNQPRACSGDAACAGACEAGSSECANKELPQCCADAKALGKECEHCADKK